MELQLPHLKSLSHSTITNGEKKQFFATPTSEEENIMARSTIERYQDIKDGIENIMDLIGEYNKTNYDHVMSNSSLFRNSVLSNYQNIGEAIRRISPKIRSKHKEINWKSFVELRNDIVHRYENSMQNSELVWNSVQNGEFRKLYTFVKNEINQHQLEVQSKPVESKLTQQPEKEVKPSPSFKM